MYVSTVADTKFIIAIQLSELVIFDKTHRH